MEQRKFDAAMDRVPHPPQRESKSSPLEVKGVKVRVSADDLVAIVREGRDVQEIAIEPLG